MLSDYRYYDAIGESVKRIVCYGFEVGCMISLWPETALETPKYRKIDNVLREGIEGVPELRAWRRGAGHFVSTLSCARLIATGHRKNLPEKEIVR